MFPLHSCVQKRSMFLRFRKWIENYYDMRKFTFKEMKQKRAEHSPTENIFYHLPKKTDP